jgi:calcineurin-like phosphoesterase family protein
MRNRWVVSDTHFGHKGVTQFLKADGTKIRPWDDPDKMDEDMVQMWNEIVKPDDRVYHLGDVVINRRCLPIMNRLNGKKVLIKGNHDIFKLEEYSLYFEDIRSYNVLVKEGIIMSHIPVHPSQLERWKANVHGHLHTNVLDDPRYINVCVEQTGFKPILLEEVLDKVSKIG